MKTILSFLIGTFLAMSAATAFAAATPYVGTWTLNAEKSKFTGPSFKSQTRTYAEAADGTVTMTFTGAAGDGTAVNGGSTFKYDGKDYPITGSADFDTLSSKKVNGSTANFSLKKSGVAVGTGTRIVSAHGKVLTLTTKIKGADGKAYTSVMVFDKQ